MKKLSSIFLVLLCFILGSSGRLLADPITPVSGSMYKIKHAVTGFYVSNNASKKIIVKTDGTGDDVVFLFMKSGEDGGSDYFNAQQLSSGGFLAKDPATSDAWEPLLTTKITDIALPEGQFKVSIRDTYNVLVNMKNKASTTQHFGTNDLVPVADAVMYWDKAYSTRSQLLLEEVTPTADQTAKALANMKTALQNAIDQIDVALLIEGNFPSEAKTTLEAKKVSSQGVLAGAGATITILYDEIKSVFAAISVYKAAQIKPVFPAVAGTSYRIFCANPDVPGYVYMGALVSGTSEYSMMCNVATTAINQLFQFEAQATENVFKIKYIGDGSLTNYCVFSRGNNNHDVRMKSITPTDATAANNWTITYAETIGGIDYYTFTSNNAYLFLNYNGSPASGADVGKLKTRSAVGNTVPVSSYRIGIVAATAVNKVFLKNLFATASALYNATEEGTQIGQYPAALRTALNTAITNAQTQISESTSTQLQVEEALASLNTALSDYKAGKIIPVFSPVADTKYYIKSDLYYDKGIATPPAGWCFAYDGIALVAQEYAGTIAQQWEFVKVDGVDNTYQIKQGDMAIAYSGTGNNDYSVVTADIAAASQHFVFHYDEAVGAKLPGYCFVMTQADKTTCLMIHSSGVPRFEASHAHTNTAHWMHFAPVVDLSLLSAKITAVEGVLLVAVEGTLEGQYPVGSKAILQAVLDQAVAVAADPASQAAIDEILASLTTALTTFEGKVVGPPAQAVLPVSGKMYKIKNAVSETYYLGNVATDLTRPAIRMEAVGDTTLFVFVKTAEVSGTSYFGMQQLTSGSYVSKEPASAWNPLYTVNYTLPEAQFAIETLEDSLLIKCRINNMYMAPNTPFAENGYVYLDKAVTFASNRWMLEEVTPTTEQAAKALQNIKTSLLLAINSIDATLALAGNFGQPEKTALEAEKAIALALKDKADATIAEVVAELLIITQKVDAYKASQIIPPFPAQAGVSYRIYSADAFNVGGYVKWPEKDDATVIYSALDQATNFQLFQFEALTGDTFKIKSVASANAAGGYLYSRGSGGTGMAVRIGNTGANGWSEIRSKWVIKYVETIGGVDYYSFKAPDNGLYMYMNTVDGSPQVKTLALPYSPAAGRYAEYRVAIVQDGVVNKGPLKTAVSVATALYNSSTEGEQPGQYPAAARTIFDGVITAAQAILDAAQSTEEQCTAEISTLATAMATFKASRIAPAFVPITGATYYIQSDYQSTTLEKWVFAKSEVAEENTLVAQLYSGTDKQLWEFVKIEGKDHTYQIKQGNLAIAYVGQGQNDFAIATADVTAENQQFVFTYVEAATKKFAGDCFTISQLNAGTSLMIHNTKVPRFETASATNVAHWMHIELVGLPAIDKEVLTPAITAAENALTDAVEGEFNGQYPVGSKAILQAVLDEAKAMYTTGSPADQGVVIELKTRLETATANFIAKQISIDFTALNTALTKAESYKTSTTELGSGKGKIAQTDYDAFVNVYNTAFALNNSSTASQTAVDEATTALNAALTTFINVLKAELKAIMAETNALLIDAEEGTENGQYPVGSKEILQTAYDAATSKLNMTSSRQAQFNEASLALQTALDEFKAKKIVIDGLDATALDALQIYAEGKVLYVKNLAGNATIAAYDLNGRLIFSEIASEGDFNHALAVGKYIVVVQQAIGSKRMVVVVR